MSRLGRNPFEQKPRRALDYVKQMEEERIRPKPAVHRCGLAEKLARFVLVDVRAEGYLFALKAYLLAARI